MNIWVRLWFTALVIIDRLLGTHLVEWQLARLQHRLKVFGAQASVIRQQMENLNHLLHIAQVELCVFYLRQRHLLRPDTWLCFVPAESAGEERDLDLLINRLAKHGLATVHTEAVGEQTYVYHLHPDWAAIEDLLTAWKEDLDPATASWLDERRSNENG